MYYRRGGSDTVGCLIGCLMWFLLFLFAIGGLYNWIFEEDKEFDSQKIPVEIQKMNFEYDSLQKLFLMINENTTREELEKYAKDNNLYYSYNNAFERDPKDSLRISNVKDGELTGRSREDTADYIEIHFTEDNFKLTSVQYYKYGDLLFTPLVYATYLVSDKYYPNTGFLPEYKGYYLNDISKRDQGIEMKNKTGSSSKTSYFKKENAEDALRSVLIITEAAKQHNEKYPKEKKQ